MQEHIKEVFSRIPMWRALYNELGSLFEVQRFILKYNFHRANETMEDILRTRLKHLREELDELEEAIENRDEYAVWDAIVDLAYILVGLVFLIQMPFKKCFDRVHSANMAKVACKTPEESKRNQLPDVYKPDGWEEPTFDDLKKVGLFDLQDGSN